MKFFRLNEGCFIIDGEDTSCIYNTISGDIIKINKEISAIINKCDRNEKCDDIDDNSKSILNQLQNLNVGEFLEKPVYVPKLTFCDESKIEMFNKANYSIKNLFIEITNECNINCVFCKDDDPSVFRKTGCKKWTLQNNNIDIKRLKEIIKEAKNLGCQNLFYMGGEPLTKFSVVEELINYSVDIGIEKNIIFTNGTILNDSIIEFFKLKNVSLIIQAYSVKNDICEKITSKKNLATLVIKNIKKLIENNIDLSLNILINKFNENDVEESYKEFSTFIDKQRITLEYIYPNGNNTFYSKKYYSEMFCKKNSLSKVYLSNFYSNQNKHNCYGYQLAISGNGDVIPCIMSRKSILGNIAKDNLIDILGKSKYIELSNITKDSIKKCKKCDMRYGCFDCRAMEEDATNDLYGMKYCDRI